MKRPSARTFITWLIVASLATFAVYRFMFATVPVVAYTVIRGEVMGPITLEARVKTTVSDRIPERLLKVLVAPP